MDPSTIALALAAFLFAAFLKGITGLGFSTICLPILTLFIEPRISIPLVILPSLTSNLLVMVQAGRFVPALSRFWYILLAAVPGLVLGVYLLGSVEASSSRVVLGAILILYALWAFRSRGIGLSKKAEAWLGVPVGLINGVINGLTGSQVMPVLPFMLSLKMDRKMFIQSINIFFTFCSLVMLFLLNRQGLIEPRLMLTSLMGIIPVALGIFLGGRLRQKLSEAAYRRAVLIFLMLIGVSLIFRA